MQQRSKATYKIHNQPVGNQVSTKYEGNISSQFPQHLPKAHRKKAADTMSTKTRTKANPNQSEVYQNRSNAATTVSR